MKNNKQIPQSPSQSVVMDRAAMDRFYRKHLRYSLAGQGILFFFFFLLWWIPIPNPIKLLVVLFHEMSHVMAAYLTEGLVFGLAIDPAGAGITLGMGGNEPLIVAAGYMGSLFFGCLLYYLLSRWEPKEVWVVLCILCCVSIGFGWLNQFTAFFGYGAMLLMGAGLFWLSPIAKRIFCRLIATTCCLYPVIDVAGEWIRDGKAGFEIAGQRTGSDVARLAELSGVPEPLLAAVWFAAGALAVTTLIVWSARLDAGTHLERNLFRFRKRPLWAIEEPPLVRRSRLPQ